MLEGRVVPRKEGSTETDDLGNGDTGEGVEGAKVASDLGSVGGAGVGHGVVGDLVTGDEPVGDLRKEGKGKFRTTTTGEETRVRTIE